MILLVGIVVGIVLGLVLGGRLAHLGNLRINRSGVLFAALAVQVIIFSALPEHVPSLLIAAPWLYVASLAVVLAVIWGNRHLSGMRLLFAGAALNALVITANGGQMPRRDPLPETPPTGIVHGAFTNTRWAAEDVWLLPLGDVLEVPGQPGYLISIGDVAIAVGAGSLAAAGTRPRRFARFPVTSREA